MLLIKYRLLFHLFREMENGVEERKWQTDKGYAWVVLAAASLTALLRAGQASVMGIYLVLFYQAYPDSTTLLSSIIAMSAFTSAALGMSLRSTC